MSGLQKMARRGIPFWAGVVLCVVILSTTLYVTWKGVRRVAAMRQYTDLLEWVTDVRHENERHSSKNEDADSSVLKLNHRIVNGRFRDLLMNAGSIREYAGKILVISMTSADCPISKKLAPALARLPGDFDGEGIAFLLVNTDSAAQEEALKEHADRFPNWRYVHDKESSLVAAVGARSTTETFVIDQAQTLRYRGSVDNRFEVGVTRFDGGIPHLSNAISAVIKGESLALALTDAPGCPLEPVTAEVVPDPVTWGNQISRLVLYNCVECHRSGGAAPFPLETYEQVVSKKAAIKWVLKNGIMPPWFASPAFGKWKNSRRLSDTDRQMFSDWVADGCSEGDPSQAPIQLTRASGWSIREPDIIIDVQPQMIPAEGNIEWRKFPVSFTVTNDLWVAEAEIRPSVPEVVHHAMLYIEYPADDPRGQKQPRAESEESGGAHGFWLSYFPGRRALALPAGRAKLIPRNGRIFIQMHYVANGTEVVDETRIGLKLLDTAPEKQIYTSSVIKWDFVIPPNSKPEFVHSEVFEEDIRLLSLMPHMHSRGAGAQVFLQRKDGRVETLLDVPKYDPEWQLSYEFAEPLLITRGDRMVIRHEYDNTQANPGAPDPSKPVRHGNRTSNDMMITFFDWESVGEENLRSQRRPFR